MAKWNHDFRGVVYDEAKISESIVLIIGPTGSGKTHLANLLTNESSLFKVVPNCTTRKARPTDSTGHFKYLDDQTFNENLKQEAFFLARKSPLPNYGYLKKDLNEVFSLGSIAVFMFRYSGLRYIHKYLKQYCVVFIESDPALILKHSKDSFAPPCLNDIEMNLEENRKLYKDLKSTSSCILIKNDYAGALLLAKEQIIQAF